MITEYPLQPFSPRYFNGDYNTFAQQWWFNEKAADKVDFVAIEEGQVMSLIAPSADHDTSLPIELDLQQLIRFFRHPCQSFMNQTLKVWLPLTQAGQFDHEPFSLNGLDNYLLANQIVTRQLESGNLQLLLDEVCAQGILPQGQFGQLAFRRQVNEVQALVERLQPVLTQPAVDLECDLLCSVQGDMASDNRQVKLTGWLKNHYDAGLVSYKVGGLNGKDQLQHWILHLAYCAMGYPDRGSYLFGKTAAVKFKMLTPESAQQHLNALIGLYLKGHQQPLALFPNSAYAWAAKMCEKDPQYLQLQDRDQALVEKARAEALKRFDGNFVAQGEGQDPYITRCYQDLNLLWHDFESHSTTLFGPLFAYLSALEEV